MAELPTFSQEENRLSNQVKVFVKQFAFVGNTIFSEDELRNLVIEYEYQELTTEELYAIRNKLTRHYINHGYINSGIVLPDQEVIDGVITFEVVEGKLTEIKLNGNKRIRSHYILSRVDNGVSEPLNIFELRRPLQLLHEDRLIKQINSELGPGIRPGESVLNIEVVEAKNYDAVISFNNHRSPSIGSYQAELDFAYHNITGWGDSIGGSYALTEGLDSWSVFAGAPLTRWDTRFIASYEENQSNVTIEEFNDLDIESESETISARLRQPLYRTPSKEFVLEASLNKKRSKTFLLGEGFAFPLTTSSGISEVTLLNLVQEWVARSQRHVIAARSTFGIGLDWLNATVNEGIEADGKFITWLGQFQYLRRLDTLDSQLLLSADLRLADSPLLPLERFALGGSGTVRGYRENELTRDNGFLTRLEWRVPIYTLKIPRISKRLDDGQIQLAPFFDYGRGWNRGESSTPDPRSISSAGLGIRWLPSRNLRSEIYWGHALRDIERTGEYDLQDDGIHFQVIMEIF